MTKKLKNMETRQHKYRFYATLLDNFHDYINSDVIWEKYWGWSETPPHTPEEFHKLQFDGLIDRINRIPLDSEAADRGTAFNEIVDCMVENRGSSKVKISRVYNSETNKVVGIKALYNNREFTFPIGMCTSFAKMFEGALTQVWVESLLPTKFGNVLLCGMIDELLHSSVHDIKLTGNYSAAKFKNHWQHIVYPYCLIQSGIDIRTFEYNVAELNKNGIFNSYTETYVFNPDRDVPLLTEHCEEFIQFLEENKHLITDKKIFGNE